MQKRKCRMLPANTSYRTESRTWRVLATIGRHQRYIRAGPRWRLFLLAIGQFSLNVVGSSALSQVQLLQPWHEQPGALLSRRASLLGAAAGLASTPLKAAWAAEDVAKARAQMESGAQALDDLLKKYDDITAADGGNGVRRVLGKLGPTSPLHRVDKALGLVARELEDESAFELVDVFLGQLDAADGDAYSSIFVPTGGGTTPEYWLIRSKKEIKEARSTLGRILELQ